MKKTIAMVCALVALVSCNKQMTEPALQDEGKQKVQVELTINRADVFGGTKAAAASSIVKNDWYEDDVVFVFFEGVGGVSDAKHLKATCTDAVNKTWSITEEAGLDLSTDLSASGKMLAVFLPYGSDALPVEDGLGGFSLLQLVDGELVPYRGYFLYDDTATFTFDGTKLEGALNLTAYAPSEGPLVHFDIAGYASGDAYELYQEYVCPICLNGISVSTGVNVTTGGAGKAIPGYVDGQKGVLSFSGVLPEMPVQKAEFQFSVNDAAKSTLYTMNAGAKRVPTVATSIGLGNLSKWTATEYVDLGIKNDAGQRVMWAKKNLGATTEKGEGSYGLYFAWGETTGYPLEGNLTDGYTCSHSFNTNPIYEVDANKNLKPEYDAAHVALGGLWRMPTQVEWEALIENTNIPDYTSGTVDSGKTFTGKGDYEGKSVFFPAAGGVFKNTVAGQGETGNYWLSSEYDTDKAWYLGLSFNGVRQGWYETYDGFTVRPVFAID